jgi:hypothetical protein
MRRELRRVDEDRDDDAPGMALGFLDQRDMAFMQRAHGRHQRDLLAGFMPARDGLAHGGDRLEDGYAAHVCRPASGRNSQPAIRAATCIAPRDCKAVDG